MRTFTGGHLYNDLSSFLKNKFGDKVYKVSLKGPFGCPNLDGKISNDGCIFCNNESITPAEYEQGDDLKVQLRNGMDYIRERHNANLFIAYLQQYSNTYAHLKDLREIYEPLLIPPEVVGMAVATRPDCVDEEIINYMAHLKQKKYFWLELGLQSCHDTTLSLINRGHKYDDFVYALKLAQSRDIPVCVHVIFGLPGENRDMMLETVKRLSSMKIFGIKIHSLHVVKNTRLYDQYKNGNIEFMDMDEYAELVADSLEYLDPDIVIHRLTGEGPKDLTVAPDWIFNKLKVINMIKEKLKNRGSFQGFRL